MTNALLFDGLLTRTFALMQLSNVALHVAINTVAAACLLERIHDIV